jgi:ABC-2 type transport system ATP-binding protein
VSFEVAAGQAVAVLGPNGAGKSTTIDMLLGLAQPDRGRVEIAGLEPSEAIAAGRVGAMLQTGALVRYLSVRELIAMMGSLYERALPVDDLLEMAGISAIADRRTEKLSGGETQRARFAVAVVSDPDVLVLDEPTVGMDVEGRRAFWEAMRAFSERGRTVIFATHYLEEAERYADRVVLMARGEVVADGPTGEVTSVVGLKTIRVSVPGAGVEELASLPGASSAEPRGEATLISCQDSDRAIRALLERYPQARDIEISGAGLEQAFIELTKGEDSTGAGAGAAVPERSSS